MSDPADKLVRQLMEKYASQDEAGEYGLKLFGDDWRRFCAELERAIRALTEPR